MSIRRRIRKKSSTAPTTGCSRGIWWGLTQITRSWSLTASQPELSRGRRFLHEGAEDIDGTWSHTFSIWLAQGERKAEHPLLQTQTIGGWRSGLHDSYPWARRGGS